MKILIVDDDSTQRELLRGFLDKQGYPTLTAANGHEALQLFQSEQVHLVLLDHRMPGLTGDEVLEKMKAANPMVRAIMITAYGDNSTETKVRELGAVHFLTKPVDFEALKDELARTLENGGRS